MAAVRVLALNHVVHHRGQLSVYLRLLDVPLTVARAGVRDGIAISLIQDAAVAAA